MASSGAPPATPSSDGAGDMRLEDNSAADARQAIRAAQASADAALHSKFEQGQFNYAETVDASRNITLNAGPSHGVDPAAGVSVTAYLQRMQRGGEIQPFGCLLVLEENTFNVVAFSENAPEMLQPPPRAQADVSPCASPRSGSPSRDHSDGIRKRSSVGAAFRSLSIKITQAITTNRQKQAGKAGKPADPAKSEASPSKPSTAPSSPDRHGANSASNSASLERTDSGSKWNPFRRLSSSNNNSPRSSPPGTPRANGGPAASIVGESAVGLSPTPAPPAPVEVGFGVCGLSLFTSDSAAAIRKVSRANDVSMMNPVLVQTVGNGAPSTEKPFYAIFHRTTDGLHMDLEPIRPEDAVFTGEGALQAHRLASKGMARLQRVPAGHLKELCEAVAEEVRELTGYDRVMCYKFHEDEHGEVLAEARKETMEPYLGLHYPATDIPQAARFLFMKNRVRIIVDCTKEPVKVNFDGSKLKQQVVLSNSTLRAVHGCHRQYMANMGTLGSIGMAIVVNDPDAKPDPAATPGRDRAKKLWGLVVCHHEEARYLPYPLRMACEFLMQVFSLKVNMEMEVASQEKEKHMLRMQTLLCDMLQRDAPVGIMTQYPNIMDLVKCEGAALLYGGRFWTLGSTPTHNQMRDIVTWLQQEHGESSGFSTDSLKDSGYPNAETLGDNVCGMIAAQLLGGDYLMWFRAHVEKEVVWSGARHAKGERDDGNKMNPRSSFAAFLEVVKHRSQPWDDIDIDAVSSLVLILRGHLTSFSASDFKSMEVARLSERDVERMSIAESELSRILETATAPVFTVDKQGCITAWNARLTKLTGLNPGEALGMSLLDEIVTEGCQHEAAQALYCALHGQEAKNIEIKLKTFGGARPRNSASPGPQFTRGASEGEVILVMNAFVSRGGLLEDEDAVPGGSSKGAVSGVCFVGQDVTAQKMVEGHFTKVQGDYAAIVHSGNSLIPPIFAINEHGQCAEWNPAMETLTGLKREEALGHMILGGVFGTMLKMKNDVKTKLMIVLNKGVSGSNTERYPLAFLSREGHLVEALLTVNARRDGKGSGEVMGAFCFLHIASPELQAAIKLQRAAEEFAEAKAKTVAYMRQEIKGPLDGVKFVRGRMEGWGHLDETQRRVLETSVRCEQQLTRVLGDDNIENLEEGYLGLEADEYRLENVVEAVVSIGKQAAAKRGIDFTCECTENIAQKPNLCGDAMRLQQALAEFVAVAVAFTAPGGSVELLVISGGRSFFVDPNSLRIEFRVKSSGISGVPNPIVQQMMDTCQDKTQMTQEGLGLAVARKIIQAMFGDVQYDRVSDGRVPDHCAFVVRMALPYPRAASSCATPLNHSGRYNTNVDESGLDSSVEILAN